MVQSDGKPRTGPGPASREVRQALEAAVAEHREDRLEAAIAGYRKVLRLQPNFPQAHNNLAVALRAAGQPQEAAASYRRALDLKPDYPVAHANLASTLLSLGNHQEGLRHAFEAVRLEPGKPGHLQVLAGALRTMRFSRASPLVSRAVESCFQASGIEHQLLTPVALSLLRLNPATDMALKLSAAGEEQELMAAIQEGTLQPLMDDPLFLAVLTKSLVPDAGFEDLLTLLRRCCLRLVVNADATLPALFRDSPGFLAALAAQCFIADYAYVESQDETELLEQLLDRSVPGKKLSGDLIVLSMYRPLHDLPGCGSLAGGTDRHTEPFRRLIQLQLLEPLTERDTEPSLPALTRVDDPVSKAVRQQYEANPYPRWLSTGSKAAKPLADIVASLFPHPARMPEPVGPLRVLVAGCGTGKHAVDVATRYAGAEILAIDVSRRSLAYAQRKACEAGLTNLDFAQADILELAALARAFDLIESVGVLHHLGDPQRGWRQLVDLLAPAGLMKVGLYSKRARRFIAAARAWVRQGGFSADASGIRAARRAILDLDPATPARQVAGELDFYGLSGCRDLLFNVQERDYTLPEVAEALADLDLEFLGFELLDPEVRKAYADRFPEDPTLTDLRLWDTFEAEEPDTFHNMYQFWCRRM